MSSPARMRAHNCAARLDLAHVSLPWVSRGDREEIARRIGEVVERGRLATRT
jgi:hypothetical protein